MILNVVALLVVLARRMPEWLSTSSFFTSLTAGESYGNVLLHPF